MSSPSDEDGKHVRTRVILAAHVKDPSAVGYRGRVGEVFPVALAKAIGIIYIIGYSPAIASQSVTIKPKLNWHTLVGLGSAALAAAAALPW